MLVAYDKPLTKCNLLDLRLEFWSVALHHKTAHLGCTLDKAYHLVEATAMACRLRQQTIDCCRSLDKANLARGCKVEPHRIVAHTPPSLLWCNLGNISIHCLPAHHYGLRIDAVAVYEGSQVSRCSSATHTAIAVLRLVVGACLGIDHSVVGVRLQEIDLHLQLVGVGPIVIALA